MAKQLETDREDETKRLEQAIFLYSNREWTRINTNETNVGPSLAKRSVSADDLHTRRFASEGPTKKMSDSRAYWTASRNNEQDHAQAC